MRDSLNHSYLVSELSYFLTIAHSFWATWANPSQSLICPQQFAHFAQKEWVRFFVFLNFQKTLKKRTNIRFFWVNHSFFVSERKNEQFAKKLSDSLICSERLEQSLTFAHLSEWLEQFAHSRSFVLSNLSEWAWSKFPTLLKTQVYFYLWSYFLVKVEILESVKKLNLNADFYNEISDNRFRTSKTLGHRN